MTAAPPFPNPPLALTVLEIRYLSLIEGQGTTIERKMREAVQAELPLFENMAESEIQIEVGSSAPPAVSQQTSQRFFSRDRTTALVIRDAALVLETTTYSGWEQGFRPLVKRVVDAFDEIGAPSGVTRIGLRYIDEIRVPSIDSLPGDWGEYIDGHLLAAIDSDFVPESLRPTVWQGVVQYRTKHDATMTVRYGPQEGHAVAVDGATRRKAAPDGGTYFLLDTDSFWQHDDEIPEFRANWIMSKCDHLHAPTREFFRIAVTDKLRTDVFQIDGGGKE